MSLCDNTLGFATFLKENSNSLLNFYPTGRREKPVLVINVPSSNPYYELTQKFIYQMIYSKRLDLDSFKGSEIVPDLLSKINIIVHIFIHELASKKHLTAYIEGLR